jgi:membrane associated rhomboid family serine protease
MRGSWEQSRLGRERDRWGDSLHALVVRFGSVTQLIIWVTVIVFLIQLVCVALRVSVIEEWLALSGTGVAHGLVWQPVTYMFLHDPDRLFHILINLLVLWFFGREVEYFIGPKYFTRLYLCGGLMGAALHLAFNWHSSIPVLGASAAVLACVIAFATLFPDREVTLLLFFIIPVRLKAKYLALIAIAFDVVPLLSRTGGNVAHLAHLGGALFGYLYIKQLGYGATPRWLFWLQNIGEKLRPKRRPAPREMTSEEFISQEVDPILDKIAREGIHSLTRRERKILESAKDELQRRQR